MVSRSREYRYILLQWFLSLQYVFNNEHATVFIHRRHFSKPKLATKKPTENQLFFQTFDLKTAHSLIQKRLHSLYASSVFFNTNANTSPCVKPCMCKRQSWGNQTESSPLYQHGNR